MLKKIEIWDFESHEHTLIDDIDAGLNFIVGESNSGKSSIIRALKLVAYNQFDPRSVRVGAAFCRVRVETDKGYVEVKRGAKHNFWTVCKNGEEAQEFDKVGRAVVPQAAEVIGMKVVKLGDTDVPVNIMDQLETHFMLDSVGDKDASGSMRAQIVDEISGLSGIEGIIRSVGLDLHRAVREVNDLEGRIKETGAQKHDPVALANDKGVVLRVESLVEGAIENFKRADVLAKIGDDYVDLAEALQTAEDEIDRIPDLDRVRRSLDQVADFVRDAVDGSKVVDEHSNANVVYQDLNFQLGKIPNVDRAAKLLERVSTVAPRLTSADETYKLWDASNVQRNAIEEAFAESEVEIATSQPLIEAAGKILERVSRGAVVLNDSVTVKREAAKVENQVAVLEDELKEAKAELEGIIDSVQVCPLTLAAVSGECLKKAKEVA